MNLLYEKQQIRMSRKVSYLEFKELFLSVVRDAALVQLSKRLNRTSRIAWSAPN
jgi:hypothetical protein